MKEYGLRFDSPAKYWLEALPLGNGHIGAMVYGDPCKERIALNDDTLWSGYQRNYKNPNFAKHLSEARKLMRQGNYAEAEDIIESTMLGPFTQVYLPLGELQIEFDRTATDKCVEPCVEPCEADSPHITDYSRTLDFATGIASSSCKKCGEKQSKKQPDGYGFSSQVFCSYPHQVLVYRLVSSEPCDLSISFTSQLKSQCSVAGGELLVEGVAPSNIIIDDVYNFYSDGNVVSYDKCEKLRFSAALTVATDGKVCGLANSLHIKQATEATLYYTSVTSFAFAKPQQHCQKVLEAVVSVGFEQVRREHIADFGRLYGQVEVDFGGEATVHNNYSKHYSHDNHSSHSFNFNAHTLATLFQYGRYLLISSSRKGTQPANLQGIWNKDLIPPWWSNYTLNINLQMNYWHAHRTGLSECTEPLHTFISRLVKSGKITAETWYGMKGFVAHHQSDIWAHTTPVGFGTKREKNSASWGMWNMSGVWLCLNLYRHYQFTGDAEFLQKIAYPIYKECADFLWDWLVEIDGTLHTMPATSPEHMYMLADKGHGSKNPKQLAITQTPAIDIGLLTEFFQDLAELANCVNDQNTTQQAKATLKKIPSYTVEGGCIAEWGSLRAGVEPEDKGHRHFSHLIGAYPYTSLLRAPQNSCEDSSSRTSPQTREALVIPQDSREASEICAPLTVAATKSFYQRMDHGSGSTGWSAAWATALAARFQDAQKVEEGLAKLCSHHLHPNLFGAHPPNYFQIDANFGLTAAICEALVQDYDGIIRLLPALPTCLDSGQVCGLRLRGGHSISFSWKNRRLEQLKLTGGFEPVVRLRFLPESVRASNVSRISAQDNFAGAHSVSPTIFCNGSPIETESTSFGCKFAVARGLEYNIIV